MLPSGYQGLVVADTRRALEWESGLRARGFDVVRVETTGADADKGAWQIGVASGQKMEAQAFVTQVINGDAKLPARPFLSRTGWLALLGVALAIAALLVLGSR